MIYETIPAKYLDHTNTTFDKKMDEMMERHGMHNKPAGQLTKEQLENFLLELEQYEESDEEEEEEEDEELDEKMFHFITYHVVEKKKSKFRTDDVEGEVEEVTKEQLEGWWKAWKTGELPSEYNGTYY